MVRSLWLRALATTLVWTGVAWAQQPGSSVSDKSAEQFLTIQEAGKGPQKCQVVKTFRTSDGHQAYQVRALDTGEMMTITEKSSSTSTYGARPLSIATQIYHWGKMKVSPPGVPAPAADKSAITSYQKTATSTQSSNPSAADAPKSNSNSSYPSTYKSPAALAGGAAVTQPVPEKDWRQSWIKSEEKPLRIDDKVQAKENVAELPPLRIEGKPGAKDAVSELPATRNDAPATKTASTVLPRQDTKTLVKPTVSSAKTGLNADDPLLNPDKYTPKVLDLTLPVKVAGSNSVQAPSTLVSVSKPDPKTPHAVASEPKAARVPTLVDVAGGMGDTKMTIPAAEQAKGGVEVSKSGSVAVLPAIPEAVQPKLAPAQTAPDKSTVVFDLSKLTPPSTGPAKPASAQQPVVPELPALAEKKTEKEASQLPGGVTIPTLPLAPEPVIAAAPTVAPEKPKDAGGKSNAIGQSTVSSTPVIPPIPLQGAAPAPLALAASPVSMKMPAPPADAGAERPNFVVLEAKGAEDNDRAIKLPGVPNAVVAFGQPATVTAPPPDLVRKKTLETHTVRVMISQLKDSLYPSQRERAAEGLTSANWKVHPQVVEALCTAALDDPAPAVRGRCAESLAFMNVRSQAALGVIHKLQADKDEAVRSKADEAIKILEPEELPH
jgi:hypothetical protein